MPQQTADAHDYEKPICNQDQSAEEMTVVKHTIEGNDEANMEDANDDDEEAFDEYLMLDAKKMESDKEMSSGSSGSKRKKECNLCDNEEGDALTERTSRRLSWSIE